MGASMCEISRRFEHHPSTAEQVHTYDEIRNKARELALLVAGVVPDGRERALAVTHLEAAVMWANAGVARKKG